MRGGLQKLAFFGALVRDLLIFNGSLKTFLVNVRARDPCQES
jgi:hypothetical protein